MNDPTAIVWEECACDICGHSDSQPVFQGPDRLEGLPGEFFMARCPGCGTYRQNPRPAWQSLQQFYPEDYASHPPLVQDEPTWLRRLDKRYGPWKRVRAVERHIQSGDLLEVGCGTGLFLEEAKRSRRWRLQGIEPSQRAAQYVQQRLGVPVFAGTFEDASLPASSQDVVVMWNVLEHLAAPMQAIRRTWELLRPGGWFVFSVPNLEGWEARLFGSCWVGWDLPRHLYILPGAVLEAALTRTGFRLVERRCISTTYSLLGHNLDFWSQTWGEKHAGLRRLMLSTYRTPLARLALAPGLGISDRMQRSTIITLFAQKSGGSTP